jgi:hypothetical protein
MLMLYKIQRVVFSRPAVFILSVFFDFDDFFTLVVATVRANTMRQPHLTAVRALHEMGDLQGVVGASLVSAS